MGPASQDAHPTVPAHACGPPSGAPYGLGHGSVAQHGRAPATVGWMRIRSPPEPLRVNVTRADPVHHLPNRHGSDGGEACSSITATDPPARTHFQPDARQRHPPGRLFIAFSAGVGAMAVETETLTRRLRCRQHACEGPHRSKPYWCDAGLFLIPYAVVVRPSTMPVPRLRAGVRPGCAGCDKETLCGKTGRLSLQQRAGRKNFHPAL